jgi:hypothetical protein
MPKQIQVLVGNDKLSSRLRIATAARYDIRLRKLSPQGAPADSIDILTQGEARRGTPAAGDLRVVATYPSRLSPRRLIRAVFSGSSNAYIDSCKVHCYLAGHAAAPLR